MLGRRQNNLAFLGPSAQKSHPDAGSAGSQPIETHSEIERLQVAMTKKRASKDAANSIFKS